MSIWIVADLLLLLLIGGLGYLSMKRGFIKSSYNGLSSFVALVLVFSFHAPFQGYLEHSSVGDTVKEKIRMNVEQSLYSNSDIEATETDDGAAQRVIEDLKLPDFITVWLTDMVKNQKESYSNFKSNLTESVTDIIFPLVMQILSVIFLYLIIRICLWIFFCILKLIVEIPLFGTIDRLLGAVIGGVNALLIIYIVSALVILLTPVEAVPSVEAGINSTFIFKFFYYNNLLTNLFFK